MIAKIIQELVMEDVREFTHFRLLHYWTEIMLCLDAQGFTVEEYMKLLSIAKIL